MSEAALAHSVVTIRSLVEGDVPALERILAATGVFYDDEIEIALELMDVFLHEEGQQDYEIYSAVDEADKPLGYACIGPTPATRGTFDLYWIAVDPAIHSKGVGRQLQYYVEHVVLERGGRLLIAETSSRPVYENTRKFYLATGYKEVARIEAYYAVGDDLVVYGKYLSQSKEHSN
jgi:GNAT superfamily N-acetyltransferase